MLENNEERPANLTDLELEQLSKEELITKWKQMQFYAQHLQKQNTDYLTQLNGKSFEIAKLKNLILMRQVSSFCSILCRCFLQTCKAILSGSCQRYGLQFEPHY